MKKYILSFLLLIVSTACIMAGCTYSHQNYDNIPISINNSWRVDEDSRIYLDLEITNNTNKTIKYFRAAYFIYTYDSNGYLRTITEHGFGNLLIMGENKLLHGKSTESISLPTSFSSEDIHRIEVNLYVSWIDFTWFGGEWGNKSVNSSSDPGIAKIAVKLDIQPYIV